MPGPVEPDRVYTPAELAEAIGRGVHYVYDLCRCGLLCHARSRPGGKGPITVTGRAWLDYRRRCEAGGEAITDAEDGPPAGTRDRIRRPRISVKRPDPMEELERVARRL